MMTQVHSARRGDAGAANPIDRQLRTIKGLLFGVGLAMGAVTGWLVGSGQMEFGGSWPPALATGIAALYLLALAAGSVTLSKVIDEVELGRTYKAAAFAGSVYVVVYPVWFLLWKGGFVAEPIHGLMFVLYMLSLAAGAIYYRFR